MSKPYITAIIIALGLPGVAGCSGPSAIEQQRRLDQMLEGREPGTRVTCIPTSAPRAKLTLLRDLGVVYEIGNVVYYAKMALPVEFDADQIKFKRARNDRLCEGDSLVGVAPNRSNTGSIKLPSFIPYVRR